MDGLEQRLADEAKRRLWIWVLVGGGAGVLGTSFLIVIIVAVAALFLAGIGMWAAHLFTGAPPKGMNTARTLAWLPAVDKYGAAEPNSLDLSVIAQAFGGEVYGDRRYCVDGSAEQSSGIVAPRHMEPVGMTWVALTG